MFDALTRACPCRLLYNSLFALLPVNMLNVPSLIQKFQEKFQKICNTCTHTLMFKSCLFFRDANNFDEDNEEAPTKEEVKSIQAKFERYMYK